MRDDQEAEEMIEVATENWDTQYGPMLDDLVRQIDENPELFAQYDPLKPAQVNQNG